MAPFRQAGPAPLPRAGPHRAPFAFSSARRRLSRDLRSKEALMPDENSWESDVAEFLVCRSCGSPCYLYELDGDKILEAVCQMCGNEDIREFEIGDSD